MKNIPVPSILYLLLSAIFPKWIFMFTGLGVIGCFFILFLSREKIVCNENRYNL